MLFLVPTHKLEDDGNGSTQASKVLVVLPRKTDLCSNVVVSEKAITTTLGTNDTLDTINPYDIHRRGSSTSTPNHAKDYLGVSQPTWPQQGQTNTPEPTQQPNSNHGKDSQRLGISDAMTRARRHSHTGLVESDLDSQIPFSRTRSRSRQSISHGVPYQYQRAKTPKSLRSVFRRYRTTEESPLLTSASFGTLYRFGATINEFDMEDAISSDPLKIVTQRDSTGRLQHSGSTLSNIRPLSVITGIDGLSSQELLHYAPTQEAMHIEPDSDGEIETDLGIESDQAALATTSSSISTTKRQRRESSETVDIDGISDEDVESASAKQAASNNNSNNDDHLEAPRQQKDGSSGSESASGSDVEQSPGEDPESMDIESDALDADMNMILGMASDMDLVMPQFDDAYLHDWKAGPAFMGLSSQRASSVASVGSASSLAGSHSSCTTITVSSHSTPESHEVGPRLSSVPQMDSPPVSPAILAARAHSHSPFRSARSSDGSLSPRSSSSQPSGPQDLTTIHRDIDNLRRHRDSLKENIDSKGSGSSSSVPEASSSINQKLGSISSASSTSAASISSSSSDRKGQPGPIYFKPTRLPDQPPHQNVMIIQSNQWTFDSKTPSGIPGVPPPLAVSNRDGNQIYKMNEPLSQSISLLPKPLPPASTQPPQASSLSSVTTQSHPIVHAALQQPGQQPPQSRSRSPEVQVVRRVTTKAISMATRNNPVKTPQQVQDAYYAKRERQLQEQKDWRKSSGTVPITTTVPPTTIASSGLGVSVGLGPPPKVHSLERNLSGPDSELPAAYYIPPSAFRTEASVIAEREAALRQRRLEEEESLKESLLNLPSP
ncbi:hypothetical protein EMPS_06009 [Entomortierella parvispora]|uniref:Uncharacterized protein n=1 Tax=Entomortierella parvispora TaxID=205924 RepID=A0A9P3HBQ9_9FUNG|nr:hypothetical protein EMPS_06009 [Entomortierella parvispora]